MLEVIAAEDAGCEDDACKEDNSRIIESDDKLEAEDTGTELSAFDAICVSPQEVTSIAASRLMEIPNNSF